MSVVEYYRIKILRTLLSLEVQPLAIRKRGFKIKKKEGKLILIKKKIN